MPMLRREGVFITLAKPPELPTLHLNLQAETTR